MYDSKSSLVSETLSVEKGEGGVVETLIKKICGAGGGSNESNTFLFLTLLTRGEYAVTYILVCVATRREEVAVLCRLAYVPRNSSSFRF